MSSLLCPKCGKPGGVLLLNRVDPCDPCRGIHAALSAAGPAHTRKTVSSVLGPSRTYDATGACFVDRVTNFTSEGFCTALMVAGQPDVIVVVPHAVFCRMRAKDYVDVIDESGGKVSYRFLDLPLEVDKTPLPGTIFETILLDPSSRNPLAVYKTREA